MDKYEYIIKDDNEDPIIGQTFDNIDEVIGFINENFGNKDEISFIKNKNFFGEDETLDIANELGDFYDTTAEGINVAAGKNEIIDYLENLKKQKPLSPRQRSQALSPVSVPPGQSPFGSNLRSPQRGSIARSSQRGSRVQSSQRGSSVRSSQKGAGFNLSPRRSSKRSSGGVQSDLTTSVATPIVSSKMPPYMPPPSGGGGIVVGDDDYDDDIVLGALGDDDVEFDSPVKVIPKKKKSTKSSVKKSPRKKKSVKSTKKKVTKKSSTPGRTTGTKKSVTGTKRSATSIRNDANKNQYRRLKKGAKGPILAGAISAFTIGERWDNPEKYPEENEFYIVPEERLFASFKDLNDYLGNDRMKKYKYFDSSSITSDFTAEIDEKQKTKSPSKGKSKKTTKKSNTPQKPKSAGRFEKRLQRDITNGKYSKVVENDKEKGNDYVLRGKITLATVNREWVNGDKYQDFILVPEYRLAGPEENIKGYLAANQIEISDDYLSGENIYDMYDADPEEGANYDKLMKELKGKSPVQKAKAKEVRDLGEYARLMIKNGEYKFPRKIKPTSASCNRMFKKNPDFVYDGNTRMAADSIEVLQSYYHFAYGSQSEKTFIKTYNKKSPNRKYNKKLVYTIDNPPPGCSGISDKPTKKSGKKGGLDEGCKDGKIRNQITKRCVLTNGKSGQDELLRRLGEGTITSPLKKLIKK